MEGRRGGAIFGVHLDDVPTREAMVAACAGLLDGPASARVFTPNPEILLLARDDRAYAAVLNSADLAPPDGAGVAIVQSLRRRRRIRRWPGVDVGSTVVRLAVERDAAVAFVGGTAGAAPLAAAAWRRRLPGARIVVAGDGVPIGEDGRAASPEEGERLLEAIRGASPAVVLVGLGAPKQERWIANHAADLPTVKVLVGVGGAFDMWSGRLRRAPSWLRRLGLEWAWRLALEPRRLRRAFRATVVFPWRALTDRAG
jgi:N-acetylglucosaminyldiphosphoundecaprenol N-acetyl-beta-D-mannosaminyltransferase